MTIEKLRLKNFKCFKEVDLDFSRITLLTGANSSGKSSVIHALLSAFQSEKFPFYLSPNGRYINLGDFEEISFNHNKNAEIGIDISLEFDYSAKIDSRWIFNADTGMPVLNNLRTEKFSNELEIKRKRKASYSLNLKNRRYHDLDEKLIFFSLDELELELESEEVEGEWIFTLLTFTCEFESTGDHLNFIDSFRQEPQRTYYAKSKAKDKIERDGEGYIDQILEWQNRKSEKFAQLNNTLRELDLLREIAAQQLPGGRFELRVSSKGEGIWASLTDVGFGVSQFLPIIVADLQLPENSTLILAQPEIHLHPSVQASLGDYFIKQTKEQNKNYIIETHSEYLLNRIRLAIAKEEIEPEEVSIYYFENSTAGSKTYKVEFCKDGQIKNAPPNFFETYMMDAMEIALHA